jgi:hypothetical protein
MNRSITVVAGAAMLAAMTSYLWAQSGSRAPVTTPQGGSGTAPSGAYRQSTPQPPREAPFEARLWDWLQKVQYKNWAPLPGVTADPYQGEEPHGAALRLYANRVAAGKPDALPHGSILVKENYSADARTLMGITVMYRAKDYDPEHGDWFWVKYESDGRVAQMNGMSVAGRVGMCIDCHSGAGGKDFSFANDAR